MRPLPVRHQPRKRFGQHFLEAQWARKLVTAIGALPTDVFLEIGPGQGALTLPLAATGATILAVEIDRDLVAALAPKLPPNVTVVSGDVLETDILPFLTGLRPRQPVMPPGSPASPGRFRVVGNIPYNLSTPILFRLVELQQQHGLFTDATIMMQREVADRLVARPGRKEYGVLSVLLGLHAEATRVLDLPAGAFRPPPKVRSSVVRLDFRPAAGVKVADPVLFEKVVKRVFGQRRKTLANTLKGFVPDARAVLAEADIDPRRRPETLRLDELARLVDRVAGTLRTAVL